MRSKIVMAILVISSLFGLATVQAGILSGIAKALGIKENSVVGQLAQTADKIGSAVVAKKGNDAMNKYGSEQVKSYNEWSNQYNENQDRKVQKYLSEVDQFKMDYCKSHGFYELWYSQYGDNWFEREGRSWFDKQDELAERRTGERILPWHLRDATGVRDRANSGKVDGSLTNVMLRSIGLSDADARKAEEWQNSDKYGKQNILIDHSFDIIGATTDNKDMVNAFRKIAKANNQYLKDKSNPETSGIALSNMTLDLSNIVFDAYEKGVDKRKEYLAKKLNIRNKLIDQGLDPSFAKEVSGTILSIQNDKKLNEHEKTEWLRWLGFYGDEKTVLEEAKSVSQMSENQAENLLNNDSKKKREQDKQRIEDEEKMRKEREREDALSSINTFVIDSYVINEVNLNANQKEVISSLVEVLMSHNDLNIEIIGHTCDLGSEPFNEQVGMNRAEKVREYLIDSGVAEDRLSVSSAGETDPACDNTCAQNRLKNRRVTFIAK